MVDFGDDDFFATAGNGGFDGVDPFSHQYDEDQDDVYQQYQQSQQQQSQPRVRTQQRQRRASVCGTAPSSNMSSGTMIKPSRTKSTDNFSGSTSSNSSSGQVRSGSRRQPSTDTLNSMTLNGQLESIPNKPSRTKSGSGDRSVVSTQSSNGPSVSRRPGTRRASLAAGASALTSRNAMPRQQQQQYSNRMEADSNVLQPADDFGYEYDDHHQDHHRQYTNHNNNYNNNNNFTDYEDMGYGDTHNDTYYEQSQPVQQQQVEEPVRSRRQRRCSIAEVVSTAQPVPALTSSSTSSGGTMDYGYGDATPDSSNADGPPPTRGLSTSTSQRLGGAITGIGNASISNMAIPMMIPEETKRTNRRGSIAMLGNIGRKASKEPEVTATKKPTADRDRQRQGTLLDRVGASSGDGRGSNRSGTTSYSDRIMSK
jgi:hypothetical protein